MARLTRSTQQPLYAAAGVFIDEAMRSDGSLMFPGRRVWTLENVREFHRLFVEQEDTSKDSFNKKMLRQLESASDDILVLAAELVFFHSLGVYNQKSGSKRAMIEPLLERAGVEFPPALDSALEDGVSNQGAALSNRDKHIKLLVEFMLTWKQLSVEEASALLSDAAAFWRFVFDIPGRAGDITQRNMLIHLVFPDEFEPIASAGVKNDIVKAFDDHISDADANIDQKLAEIRQALSGKHGPDFNFYDNDVKVRWGTVQESLPDLPSDPVESIAAMMAAMYPDGDLRVLILNLLVDAIEMAHAVNPASWGVGPDAKHTYMGLNVGRLATIGLHPERVLITLDEPSLEESTRAQLDEAGMKEGGLFRSVSTSRYWHIEPDALPGLLDQIMPALSTHVENAATAVVTTPYARFHSHAALEYLSSATNRKLPEPVQRSMPEIPGKSGWDGFVAWATRVFDEERFDVWERDYKLAIAGRLQAARNAFEAESEEWPTLLRAAFTKENNLTPWQQHSKFYEWAREEQGAARSALSAIWNAEAEVSERIRGFCRALPPEVVGGSGTRLAIASFLLMVEPAAHPIFRPTPFKEAYRLTGWDAPSADADEADNYEAALAFMDELRRRLREVGVETRDRLDAQGLVWAVVNWDQPPQYLSPEERERLIRFKSGKVDSLPPEPAAPEVSTPVSAEGYVEPSFDEILQHFSDAHFRIASQTLMRYHLSLKTRGFVILSGVSGTGKSWLTRLYAQAVGGEFQLVPVAPNWTTNEDLLGFHNPVTDSYVDTDFTRFLRRAVEEQNRAEGAGTMPRPFFVVLDEMNLARVEYYFAKFLSVMEARDQEDVVVELSATERLPLPRNLFAVGTVNVDETTHGFADKVYDRAQVIELPIGEEDLAAHIGDVAHAPLLISIWRAVARVAPFAYRVADEVDRYVSGAEDAGLEWDKALDHQVLQKVLPKLARADDRVGEALTSLQEVCEGTLPLSAAKAATMHRHLEDHGFASYF